MALALVTGGAGFIGSHLVEALVARGDRVRVIDDESTGARSNLAGLHDDPRLEYACGDLADAERVESLLDGVELVFHLAAAVGVQLIVSNPFGTIQNNVYPTEVLLEAVRRRHRDGQPLRLFLASSSEVYGKNPKAVWTEEDDLVFGPTTRPRWSYGISKAVDEFLALAAWREDRLKVIIARFFNVVGPRQTGRYGMVLPRMVDAALAGGPIVVHGDGRQVRCFAHVDDVVQAVLALADAPAAFGQIFNVGSDRPVEILELARRVSAAVGGDIPLRFQTYAEAFADDFEDVRSRVPDLGKLRTAIGFTPRYSLDEVIAQVVAWRRTAADR